MGGSGSGRDVPGKRTIWAKVVYEHDRENFRSFHWDSGKGSCRGEKETQ